MKASLLTLALAFGATTNVASAQVVRESSLPERLSAATRASIVLLADSLRAERLPASTLYDKAAEGVLKGADDVRILSAVRALASRLRDARAAMGAAATEGELVAGASAIFAGVSPDALAKFSHAQRRRTPPVPLTIALTVVAELASNRVPGDMALSSVDSLLARGARDAEFNAFRSSVERGIRAGTSPRDAVTASMRMTIRNLERPPFPD